MAANAPSVSGPFSREARSLGLKLILVGALAFLLWAPALLIYALVWDRSTRADQTRNEIIAQAGGRQEIAGPVVIVPAILTIPAEKEGEPARREPRQIAFAPRRLEIDAALASETRARSIYEAVVYDAHATLTGDFALLAAPDPADGRLTLDWSAARLALRFAGAINLKGLAAAPSLEIDGETIPERFEPWGRAGGFDVPAGAPMGRRHPGGGPGAVIAAPIGAAAREGFAFRIDLDLSGGGGVFFAPTGETTTARITGDWPHPGFQGVYLPETRDMTRDGFEATWRVPYLARAVPPSFEADPGLSQLAGAAFGAELAQPNAPYQTVARALKYALMFLGIVFLTFFLFEVKLGTRAHPAQYILLGLAQVIFYLLTLAFAEHVGFTLAFLIAAAATIALSGFYAGAAFKSARRGLIAAAAFSGAYGLIYLLMKSEAYALLIGSITAFAGIAVAMAATRDIDWYGGRAEPGA